MRIRECEALHEYDSDCPRCLDWLMASNLKDGDLPEDTKLVDGVIVIECDRMLTLQEIERLQELAVRCWPDRKVAILGQGVHISHQDQLNRIETKLNDVLNHMVRKPYFGGGPG